MLLGMDMDESQTKSGTVLPTHFGHLDGAGLMGGRKLDLESNTGLDGNRVIAADVAALAGQAGDNSLPDDGLA
ncbi:MAG: hypothetical protein AMXMBFR67_26250 [Nitrospira sp.]